MLMDTVVELSDTAADDEEHPEYPAVAMCNNIIILVRYASLLVFFFVLKNVNA